MSQRMKYKVLFLGSGNCARSIMAEAILHHEGGERFEAYSAGIQAHEELDPRAVDLLRQMHLEAPHAPMNWVELANESAPVFDFIFTVADEAMLLPRAMWRGNPIFAHWGVVDPAAAQGNESQMRLAYADAFRMLSNRIKIFVNLPLRSLDLLTMQREVDLIGANAKTQVVAA